MNDFVLIRKNLFRRKLRAILMIVSILVAFAIFGVLIAFERAFNAGEEVAADDRLVVVNKINFTQPQLQRYLNQSFPREFDKLGGLVSATLTNPRLSIPSGDDRLRLDFDIGVSALGARDVSRGHFALASRLRYDPATQGLHLDNPEILSVDVPGSGSLISGGTRQLVAADHHQGIGQFQVWVVTLDPGAATGEQRHGGELVAIALQGSLDGQFEGTHAWNVPGVTHGGKLDDERYIKDAIKTVKEMFCIDPTRIYASGYSGGGRMLSQYICNGHPEFAAAGFVMGLRAGYPVERDGVWQPDIASCKPGGPISIIAFSGMKDVTNPFLGGGQPYWQYG